MRRANRVRRAIVGALIAGLAWALPAMAQGAGTTVSGVVVSSDGLPVPSAQVTVAGAAPVACGAAGQFALQIRAWPATISARAPGFSPVARQLAGPARVRFVLEPAPLAETVTVAATARNQAVTTVPVLSQVMGADRIQQAAPPNLDSLLRGFPSLGTFRRSTSLNSHPTTQGVSMLGTGTSGASRALVLQDGIPLNDPFGGWIDWLRVPETEIAEVSVVEGGASPLYGNSALAGVVDVTRQAPNQTRLSLRSSGGNQGTGLLDSYTSIGGGRLSAGLGQRSLHTDGYVPVAPGQAGAVDTPAGVTANDLAPEIRYIPNARAMLTLGGEYFGERRNNGTALELNSTALRQLNLRGALQAAGTWQGNWWAQSETFASSFTSVAANRNSEKLVLEQRVPSLAQGAALDWSADQASPWGPLHWVAGASWMHIAAVDAEVAPLSPTPNRSNDGRQTLSGVFAELEAAPAPELSLVGTLRADRWRNYAAFAAVGNGVTGFPDRASTAVSPSLGAVWHPRGAFSFRLTGYESFRAPTLNELYRPFRVGNVQTLANPLLAAERYRGLQAGVDARLPHNGLLRATYFDGWVTNAITNVTLATTPALITQQRQNVGRLRPRGEEFDARYQLAPDLTLWGGYTHLHAVVVSAPSPALIGAKVAHVPSESASLRLLARRRGWALSAEERFGGAEFDNDLNTLVLPSFWNTDLYLSRDLAGVAGWRWARALAPYLSVQNLWNRRYAVELTPTPLLSSPRLVAAGVRIELGKE